MLELTPSPKILRKGSGKKSWGKKMEGRQTKFDGAAQKQVHRGEGADKNLLEKKPPVPGGGRVLQKEKERKK